MKMTNLLKMVLMTTMSKASSIIASTRKESTISLMMTMMTKVSNLMTMTKVSNLMTMMTNVNYDDNDDKSVSSDDCPRVNVAGSQLL